MLPLHACLQSCLLCTETTPHHFPLLCGCETLHLLFVFLFVCSPLASFYVGTEMDGAKWNPADYTAFSASSLSLCSPKAKHKELRVSRAEYVITSWWTEEKEGAKRKQKREILGGGGVFWYLSVENSVLHTIYVCCFYLNVFAVMVALSHLQCTYNTLLKPIHGALFTWTKGCQISCLFPFAKHIVLWSIVWHLNAEIEVD